MSPEHDLDIDPGQRESDERELAAVLGITGFGRIHGSTKKRQHDKAFTEFNYADFVSGASGGNAVPLGPRRRRDDNGTPDDMPEAATARYSAEHVASPALAAPTTTPQPAASANHGPGSDPPRNPTDPPAGLKASEARKYRKKMKHQGAATGSGLAGFLAMGQKLPDRPVNPSSETSSTPADSTLASTPTSGLSGDNHMQPPQEKGQSTGHGAMRVAQHFNQDNAARSDHAVSHSAMEGIQSSSNDDAVQGDQAASQDIAYFRPSFIEDPWSKLT